MSAALDHQLIRQSLRDFGAREITPTIRERDRAEQHDATLLPKMAAAGILGLCLPKQYDGQGFDYLSLGIAADELERADTSARVILSVHVGLHALSILQWGTAEQKERWLGPLCRGESIGAFCLTEPDAGSDVIGIKTTARRDGDDFILSGEKTWISLAEIASNFLVVAKTDPAAGARGLSAFIVERARPGVVTSGIHGKLGGRAGNTGSVSLQEVRVPRASVLGEVGEGFKIAMSALDRGRFTVAAGAVGLIEACLAASVKYARERIVGGGPLGKQQLVQQMIAKMVAGRDVGRLLYQDLAARLNAGARITREASLAKWVNCNAAFESAHDAIQVHGAYGYSNEFPVERIFRNARGCMIYEGTREIHQLVQAEYALGYREDKPLRRNLPGWPFEVDA